MNDITLGDIMDDITVDVYPDNKKTVPAFRYADNVILVQKFRVWDTDESIVTDAGGFRYKRHLHHLENQFSAFAEYRLI